MIQIDIDRIIKKMKAKRRLAHMLAMRHQMDRESNYPFGQRYSFNRVRRAYNYATFHRVKKRNPYKRNRMYGFRFYRRY